MARYNPKIFNNLLITSIAENAAGICKTPEGMVCFVEEAVTGDIVDVYTFNKKKGYLIGKINAFIESSPKRTLPVCEHFGVCGGCKWQNLGYPFQLEEKNLKVIYTISRIGKIEAKELLPIIGCEPHYYYRNKLEYTFSNKKWKTEIDFQSSTTENELPALGFHKSGAFDKIVDIKKCHLQIDVSNRIRNFIREHCIDNQYSFYNSKNHEGLFRNLMIRTSTTGEIMVSLVLSKKVKSIIEKLFDALITQIPEITTLVYFINPKKNDSIFDLPYHVHHGPGYIQEMLGSIKYQIGPKSFFQTNTKQATILYEKIVEFAALSPTDLVYDLYTGLGSIALYIAKYCKKAIGIEYIDEAIHDAKANAKLNQIENVDFFSGDVKNILSNDFIKKMGTPDVLITDPPRAGMHEDICNKILTIESQKLIYVSCNPATMARDLNILSSKYELQKLQPVDMFPHTTHIEVIALLTLKSKL